jgi:hypothetical protein
VLIAETGLLAIVPDAAKPKLFHGVDFACYRARAICATCDEKQIWINAGESGTTYERNLSTSDNPNQPLSPQYPKSLQIQPEQFQQVPTPDRMRSDTTCSA